MADQPSKPRPRPVDALFGEAPAPTYVVEAPQVVTTAAPPPVEARAVSVPLPSFAIPPAPPPAPVTLPAAPAAGAPESFFAPVRAQLSVMSAEEEKYFAALSETIRKLYDQVETQLGDSATAAMQCMKLLRRARETYQTGDLASAEFFVESVEAKLRASAESAAASRSPAVWLLWLWFLGTLALGAFCIAITYVVNATLFGILVNPTFTVPLRAIGWGCVGGVVGAMYAMLRSVQLREYDRAFNLNYFARPVLGALMGAVLFLLSQAGILAGGGASAEVKPDEIPIGPVLLYLFAALAGFKQEYVFEFFDGVMRVALRMNADGEQGMGRR